MRIAFAASLLVLVAAGRQPAWAEPRLVVGPDASLPFDAEEVAAALATRSADVSVLLTGDADVVTIDVERRTRVLALQGLTGRAAARLVALHILDMVMPAVPATALPAERGSRPGPTIGGQLGGASASANMSTASSSSGRS